MGKFIHSGLARKIVLGLILASIVLTIVLVFIVRSHPVLSLDLSITREIQESRSPWLLLLMQFVSLLGIPWVAIVVTVIAAGLFFWKSFRREALFVLATILAGVVNGLIKIFVNRPRPTDSLITVYQKLTDPSFPSGHVVYYVVFFGFLTAVMATTAKIPRSLRITISSFSLLMIVFVSLSRLYLGAHWATDIIGGYCVGFALLSGLLYFYFRSIRSGSPA